MTVFGLPTHRPPTSPGDMALRFAAYFGTTAQFWLNVRDAWELWNELQRSAQIYGDIRKRRPRAVREAAAHAVAWEEP